MKTRNLPKNIKTLNDIAENYWWSWNQDSWDLFEKINPETWYKTRNPVLTLLQANEADLEKAANDYNFTNKLEFVNSRFESYMKEENTWFAQNHSKLASKKNPVAYF